MTKEDEFKDELDDLERTEELFAFLQGHEPDGYEIPPGDMPKLTPEQAWSVIWYLGGLNWQVTDTVERCDVCGNLFDSDSGGDCLDYDAPPYHFCDHCLRSDEYAEKVNVGSATKPSTPDADC